MKVRDLKLDSVVYDVVSIDEIRKRIVVGVSKAYMEVKSNHKRKGSNITVTKTKTFSCSFVSAWVNDKAVKYKGRFSGEIIHSNENGMKCFTTLDAAQRHQLRWRKSVLNKHLDEFKAARSIYEEFKEKYKNLSPSNPIL